jgi:hypothetical protein
VFRNKKIIKKILTNSYIISFSVLVFTSFLTLILLNTSPSTIKNSKAAIINASNNPCGGTDYFAHFWSNETIGNEFYRNHEDISGITYPVGWTTKSKPAYIPDQLTWYTEKNRIIDPVNAEITAITLTSNPTKIAGRFTDYNGNYGVGSNFSVKYALSSDPKEATWDNYPKLSLDPFDFKIQGVQQNYSQDILSQFKGSIYFEVRCKNTATSIDQTRKMVIRWGIFDNGPNQPNPTIKVTKPASTPINAPSESEKCQFGLINSEFIADNTNITKSYYGKCKALTQTGCDLLYNYQADYKYLGESFALNSRGYNVNEFNFNTLEAKIKRSSCVPRNQTACDNEYGKTDGIPNAKFINNNCIVQNDAGCNVYYGYGNTKFNKNINDCDVELVIVSIEDSSIKDIVRLQKCNFPGGILNLYKYIGNNKCSINDTSSGRLKSNSNITPSTVSSWSYTPTSAPITDTCSKAYNNNPDIYFFGYEQATGNKICEGRTKAACVILHGQTENYWAEPSTVGYKCMIFVPINADQQYIQIKNEFENFIKEKGYNSIELKYDQYDNKDDSQCNAYGATYGSDYVKINQEDIGNIKNITIPIIEKELSKYPVQALNASSLKTIYLTKNRGYAGLTCNFVPAIYYNIYSMSTTTGLVEHELGHRFDIQRHNGSGNAYSDPVWLSLNPGNKEYNYYSEDIGRKYFNIEKFQMENYVGLFPKEPNGLINGYSYTNTLEDKAVAFETLMDKTNYDYRITQHKIDSTDPYVKNKLKYWSDYLETIGIDQNYINQHFHQ